MKTIRVEALPKEPCSLCGCPGAHFCTGKPSEPVAYELITAEIPIPETPEIEGEVER